MERRCGWALALAISAALPAAPAQARDPAYAISIAPGDIADALEALSAQTGISLAYDGPLPRVAAHAVHGSFRPKEALERLLRDTGLHAIRVGPSTFRIAHQRARSGFRRTPVESADAVAGSNEEVVVTARKLAETLSSLPASISVYVPAVEEVPGRARTSGDVARQVEGLSVANLGPGRERPFIRGLADSPFGGFSQSTVSVQFDEGRVTYDAAEPGLRLVDVARVEILKGPQGPLYGTGALGGVYRVVTNRPVIGARLAAVSIDAHQVARGGGGGGAEAMLNLPLLAGVAALRIVGYARSDGGWIDDLPAPANANRSSTAGLRAALRVAPAPGWTVDLTTAAQRIESSDSQYVVRDFDNLSREAQIREPRRGDFKLAQATVAGPVGRLRLTAVTSHAWQDQRDTFDASAAAQHLGVTGAGAYHDRRAYRVFDQEIRLASPPGSGLAWTAGLSYLSAVTRATGVVEASTVPPTTIFDLHRRVSETAIFADASLPVAGPLRLEAGMRLFRATTEDERLEDIQQQSTSHALIGFTPSASLSYAFAPGRLVYARIGTALRPGGLDRADTKTGRYDADEVRSLDVGTRLRFDSGVTLGLAGFRSSWRHMQSDYLEASGLVSTHNAGDADIFGGEVSSDWRLPGGWRIVAGLTAQRPRLVHAAGGADLPRDRRLPIVPDVAARLEVERTLTLGRRSVAPYVRLNYVGHSRISFDDGLDRSMSGYALVRAGASMALGAFVLGFDLDNLLDTRADSLAYGNPFSIRSEQQFTPLRPRTATLSISNHF